MPRSGRRVERIGFSALVGFDIRFLVQVEVDVDIHLGGGRDFLFELVDNPAHKRSNLVRLTPKGRRLVDRMRKRESKILGALGSGMSEKQLRSAATVARSLREILAGEEWQGWIDKVR